MDAQAVKKSLRLTLTMGVVWAVLMFFLSSGFLEASWTDLAVQAGIWALGGVAVGAAFSWFVYLRPRKAALEQGAPVESIDEVSHRVSFTVDGGERAVLEVAEEQLRSLGGSIVERDPDGGSLLARVHSGAVDAGDLVMVSVRAQGAQVGVSLTSRPASPRMQVDGGRNYDNVQRLWSRLVDELGVDSEDAEQSAAGSSTSKGSLDRIPGSRARQLE